jgi:ferric-chelate reductase
MDGMSMPTGDPGFVPLSSTGVDFGNSTQAFDFLQDILDDSFFQVESNAYARYFWYAIAATIGAASVCGAVQRLFLKHP